MIINESRGTPNVVREIINENSKIINNIINLYKNDEIKLHINKKTLICNLSIFINFIKDDIYNGNIKFEKCIDSEFKNCEINIYSPNKDINKLKIYKSLSHELTHLYELYQIKDFFNKSSWVKTKKLNIFDNLKLNNGLIKYFRDVFYSSLSHEIRANLSSLEVFLIGLDSKDEFYLRNELEKTSEYSRYKAISNFNPNDYLLDLINKYGLYFIINVFNFFNKILEIDFKIKNEKDLLKYFNKWKKYFMDISKDYKYKIDKKIKEIIEREDINNEYYIKEEYIDCILSYSDYLYLDLREQRLDELMEINYLSYFKKTTF